jgi:hypothetical protein
VGTRAPNCKTPGAPKEGLAWFTDHFSLPHDIASNTQYHSSMASPHFSSYHCRYTSSTDTAEGPTEDHATHKDIRSLKRSQNRYAKQSAKYYGFRGVDPNWVGQPYNPVWRFDQIHWNTAARPIAGLYNPSENDGNLATCQLSAKSHTYTKKDMWLDRDVNIWPLDRRHHVGRRIREKWSWKDQEKVLRKKIKQRARTMAFEAEDAWYQDVDSVYDFNEDCEDDLYSLQGDYQSDAVFHEDATIPECTVMDDFVIIHEQSWGEDDDYTIVEEQDFDVVSIASTESAWGIG